MPRPWPTVEAHNRCASRHRAVPDGTLVQPLRDVDLVAHNPARQHILEPLRVVQHLSDELLIPVAYFYGSNRRLYVWRMTSEWGQGTCWQYRMVTPEKKIEWGEVGARAAGTDRATRPTAVMTFPTEAGERIVNVTQDVELWNTGAAKNQGWLFTVEDPDSILRFTCPIFQPDGLKLRITYEPQ